MRRVLIVVPNLNYGKFINDCLHSIECQTYPNIEVLIVDGGSTDSSLEIINGYKQKHQNWQCHVKPELNQAQSIKYGFDFMEFNHSDVMCWLNSDDLFSHDSVITDVVKIFENKNVEFLSLGGEYVDFENKFIRNINFASHPFVRCSIDIRSAFIQPSTFWLGSCYRRCSIDVKYKYVFDAIFFICCKLNALNSYYNQDLRVSKYRLHGKNLSLNIPTLRIYELSLLYKNNLHRPYASFYLLLVFKFFSLLDSHGQIGLFLKRQFRILNNIFSYLSVYRIPSI